MNAIFKYTLGGAVMAMALTSCGDYTPSGYEPVRDLPGAQNLTATIVGHNIEVKWQLPAAEGITDVQFITDANVSNPLSLGKDATSYTVVGYPWAETGLFTVKICYDGKYVSQGVSVNAEIPYEELPGVSGLAYSIDRRKVTLTWTNPDGNVDGYLITTNGDKASAITVKGRMNSYTLKAQPMETPLVYTVQPLYDTYYPGVGANTETVTVPYSEPIAGFLVLTDSTDDDEIAAREWFQQQPNTELVYGDKLDELSADDIQVLWIMVDRIGIGAGWQNLPAEVSSEAAIAKLLEYTQNGGALYLSNMATQLTVPLGIVPENMAPTVFGDGAGGSGSDVWTINPHLGWDFKDGGDQDYLERADHKIFEGITLEDPNDWGMTGIPLIGPGDREDHNCLWDCNLYGKGSFNNVISNFEQETGSLVLATWGHVRDHCVAGLVDFFASADHGRCVANGFAAYEWNQNSGPNPYQGNIEKLTQNILNYLK